MLKRQFVYGSVSNTTFLLAPKTMGHY